MKIGFDYWKTLSHHKEVLMPVVDALLAAGHQIYIISACGHDREFTTPVDIKHLIEGRPIGIIMVVWEGDKEEDAPRLKYEVIKKLGITLFFDDRTDTCQYLAERGVASFRSPFYKHFQGAVN